MKVHWSALVNELLERLVLTQAELAELCGVGQQSVSAWRLDQRAPCAPARRQLLEMARKNGIEPALCYETADTGTMSATESQALLSGIAVAEELEELGLILKSAPDELKREVVDFAAFVTERRGKKHARTR